ncbi:MAG: energy-coupling factor ABC transporter ATP-binding protein [Chloroflexota bacterium]|nr:energy-coupling factor ABC transporter ATP-binding protein [Chloroflexota bacterium]
MTTPSHDAADRRATPEKPEAVYVEKLSFRYDSLDDDPDQPAAIDTISFSLAVGELLLLAGPSGCGKSTLLKCLNGLIPNSYAGRLSGRIRLQGRSISGLSLRDLAKHIGTMLQDPDKQIIGSTVEQEIAFGMENLHTPRPVMRQRIQEVIAQLHLEECRGKATFTLSGGQRQQVAAAGLLVMEPAIFLFDEPFANLDSRAVDELEQLIENLRASQHTIIIVEHRVEEALRLNPDKVLLMRDGRQAFFGNAHDFLAIADPTQVKLPIESTLRTLSDPDQARAVLVTPIITGQHDTREQSPGDPGDPILSFEDVRYRYTTFGEEILHGISCQVRRGETIALLGPNGAGKTTLVKQALGLLRPTKGSVRLYGEDTRKLSVAELSSRIGYVFQSPGVMLFATSVRKEVSFGPENLNFAAERLNSAVRQAEEALSVSQFEDRSPLALSFGQQKRVAIASVLSMQGRILLLDEPTAGQDYRSYISFMEYLRGLPNLDALLFITHDLDLALRFTQRVLLLKDGKIVADGPPLQVLADPAMLEACNLRPTSLLNYLLTTERNIVA